MSGLSPTSAFEAAMYNHYMNGGITKFTTRTAFLSGISKSVLAIALLYHTERAEAE